MDYTFGMTIVHRVCNLSDYRLSHYFCDSILLTNELGQLSPSCIFHDHHKVFSFQKCMMQLNDIWMSEQSQSFRFSKNLLYLVCFHKTHDIHLLYGYFLTGSFMMCKINFSKPSLTYLLLNFVLSKYLGIFKFLSWKLVQKYLLGNSNIRLIHWTSKNGSNHLRALLHLRWII